jgi:hypothetical protein
MKLCMFHPVDHPMERGWVGRIDGDHVIQLASQTLQSFFTGGGSAREHAAYPLESVRLLAPVLHPPAVRIFETGTSFAFANPAAILAPGSEVQSSHEPSDDLSHGALVLYARVAAVIGAGGAVAAFTPFAEWRNPARAQPKDRDFAFGLGPVAVTPDELDPTAFEAVVRLDGDERPPTRGEAFDWAAARAHAADGTMLYPGDLLARPALAVVERVEPGVVVEIEVDGLGTLRHTVQPEVEVS